MNSKRQKVPLSPEIDFVDITQAHIDSYQEENNEEVCFYCKNCKKIVDVEKIKDTLKFQCKTCQDKRVVIGTTKTLTNYFKIIS